MSSRPVVQFESTTSIEALALSWIDHDVRPRLIVTNRLMILWANAAARAVLCKREDLETRDGVLSATQPGAQAAIVDFILDSGAGVSCWCLPRSQGGGHLLLRCQRICWKGYGLFGLCLISSGDDFKAHYVNLDTAFRLTRSEHEVLIELLNGQDADKIALSRKVSLETIRSQVRQIYAKLDVNTREGLFRKALPFFI
jgi:DNA-binding CsgD family transcriptional regulator